MKILIQRVSRASVEVEGSIIGAINQGLLVFVGVESHDDDSSLDRAVQKLINYRVFADDNAKMNLSVADIDGEILVVSQFTLAAGTRKGLRPSFSAAAEPRLAKEHYIKFVDELKRSHPKTEQGEFAADMKVSLINDGPVTFLLEI